MLNLFEESDLIVLAILLLIPFFIGLGLGWFIWS